VDLDENEANLNHIEQYLWTNEQISTCL
jgi:hypothetical protein